MRVNIACQKRLPIRMTMFAAKWCLLCCFVLGRVISPAWGADLAANNLQLEFCATYIPCQISIGIMDAAASADETNHKVRDYFNSIGRQPVRSEREYKEWLTTIKSSDRQNLVDKCTQKRGAHMLDWCEATYLLAGERSNQRPIEKKTELSEADILRFGNDQLKLLREDDDQLYSFLRVACRVEGGIVREICETNTDIVRHMLLREQEFNGDSRYRAVGLEFRSKAVAYFKQFFEWRERDRVWVALVPKNQGESVLRKGDIEQLLVNSPEQKHQTDQEQSATGFVDPFSGTSKRLETASIETRRREFYKEQESARRFTEVVIAVGQVAIAQKIQNDQLMLQRQLAASQQQAIRQQNSQQRIYSDDPSKAYVPPDPEGTRIYSDAPKTGEGAGDDVVWEGDMSNCIKYTPKQRPSTSNAQWFTLFNGCQDRLMVMWGGVELGRGGAEYFGSRSEIPPGRTDESWFLATRYSSIQLLACRVKTNLGDDVYFDEKVRACYSRKKGR
jgi:hypothetical protein